MKTWQKLGLVICILGVVGLIEYLRWKFFQGVFNSNISFWKWFFLFGGKR